MLLIGGGLVRFQVPKSGECSLLGFLVLWARLQVVILHTYLMELSDARFFNFLAFFLFLSHELGHK